MLRRQFLALPALPALAQSGPIPEPHFPSRLHQFIFRNWELANTDRLAQVIGATQANVLAVGRSMGLPRKRALTEDQLRRLYITVIRQNWHLLPESQIIQLLGWDRPKYEFTLKEDDFLSVKLGGRKPECLELHYVPPGAEENRRSAEIRRTLSEVFGKSFHVRGEPLFQFIEDLSGRSSETDGPQARAIWSPRFLYSYFALYGDPLMDPSADPFPEGYLQKLSRCGINGVWLQGVLNTLAPHRHFPEFGAGSSTRLASLKALCDRAARHGVKVYLYLNEPRAMSAEFFRSRPATRGSSHQGLYSMCTSTVEVREWLSDSLAHVFREAPNLGGVFAISMSENHTNCFSHGGAWRKERPTAGDCPRCSKRESWDVLAEMFDAMREGIRRSSASAEIIHYDWGWPDDMSDRLIPRLSKDVKLLSISEWSQPVERGGVRTQVGEYSISVPGPGPRAKRNWGIARNNGIPALAKVQFNNTWEISAVPFIPVPQLILEHCAGLRKEGVEGIMASWTCGGYPSPNLEAAASYYYDPQPDHGKILLALATKRFGAAYAASAVEAWRLFSEAFREFPYGVHMYLIPTQHGPANLLRLSPTKQSPGMILFPHDALAAWRGRYPPEVVQSQFTKLARKWKEGLALFEKIPSNPDLAIARTCFHHFQSVANQVEFYRLRDDPRLNRNRLLAVAQSELELARSQYAVARSDSTIAYEASNHYYYTPLDLAEKVLNCKHLIKSLR
jgi:hypothetical protein